MEDSGASLNVTHPSCATCGRLFDIEDDLSDGEVEEDEDDEEFVGVIQKFSRFSGGEILFVTCRECMEKTSPDLMLRKYLHRIRAGLNLGYH